MDFPDGYFRTLGHHAPRDVALALASLNGAKEHRFEIVLETSWITYPAASVALDAAECAIVMRPLRRPNVFVSAGPDNGKSSIARSIVTRHAPFRDDVSKQRNSPVIHWQMPLQPSVESFASAAVTSLGLEGMRDRPDLRWISAMYRAGGVRAVLIDGFEDVALVAKPYRRLIFDWMREFAVRAELSWILLGEPRAAQMVQECGPFGESFRHVSLSPWTEHDVRAFLETWRANVPLRHPGGLTRHTELITTLATGRLGDIVRRLKRASLSAIEKGSERILHEDLLQPVEPPEHVRRKPAYLALLV